MNRNYDPQPRFFNLGLEPIIGKSCSLVNTLLDCSAQITIGDYVSFGHEVKLLTGSHQYWHNGKERQDKSISLPITIEDGAWIATGAIICQGVTIGKNSVICAGAVVIDSVPAHQMWGGVPAKFIEELRH